MVLCSPLAKFIIIRCRPFYLLWEFTTILIVFVNIPHNCSHNNRNALQPRQWAESPSRWISHLGRDFNHADLKTAFPRIDQHTDFPTWENNTLNLVYTALRGVCKATALPHLGFFDHITVTLRPAYRPWVKVTKPIQKQVWVWPEGASSVLQDCFATTGWDMSKQAATYNNVTDVDEFMRQ